MASGIALAMNIETSKSAKKKKGAKLGDTAAPAAETTGPPADDPSTPTLTSDLATNGVDSASDGPYLKELNKYVPGTSCCLTGC
jgi:hypothetical protein